MAAGISEQDLRAIMSGTVLSGELTKGVRSRTTFNADGTGELEAWNGRFKRAWAIVEEQVCVMIGSRQECVLIERDSSTPDGYRAIQSETGVVTPFVVSTQGALIESAATSMNTGGASAPSAEEMALKLSNPTAPVMTIGNNFDLVWFDGDLDGASDESAVRYLFQSVFPFKLGAASSILLRPAIPVFFDEPVPDLEGGYSSEGIDLGGISTLESLEIANFDAITAN